MTERWIIIPNWHKRQHYKTRNVPWIKLYTDLNRRDDWRALTHAERGLLCSIWVEYAASEGVLRSADVQGRVGQRVRQRHLESLLIKGWIVFSSRQPSRQKLDASRARGRDARSREVEVLRTSTRGGLDAPPLESGASEPAKTKTDPRERAERWIANVGTDELAGLSDEHLRYLFADEFEITDPDVIATLVRRVRETHMADLAERQYQDELEAVAEEIDW